ncbi:MAG: D-alanine-D-alanine ligase [Lentimonas sp.]|jgi:D-alanine-D-alanine ligase
MIPQKMALQKMALQKMTLQKKSNKVRMKKKHIAVLMGGWNSEKEVSLSSGNAVYESLLELGFKATKVDFDRNIVTKINQIKPDIIFNALHGHYGEDGRVQGLLDILDIPYTNSGVSASSISMNKVLTREICNSVDVKSPDFAIIQKNDDINNKRIIFDEIGKPFVIKPLNEGSSVGVEVILEDMDFDLSSFEWKHGDQMIIEKYIAGTELNVAIMDDKALGAIELRPKHLFYDYECKYTPGMTDYIMPAEIPTDKYKELLDLSLRCHKVIGCSGVTRTDFILGKDNQIYLLEINTHPGFTPTSLVPKIAKHQGISFNEIVEYLVKSAKCGI